MRDGSRQNYVITTFCVEVRLEINLFAGFLVEEDKVSGYLGFI